jgi:hypothetical protein
MNQLSAIGFGPDANVFAGYAQSANDRLGAIDFIVENTSGQQAGVGANQPAGATLYLQLRQYDGNTSPSGYVNVGTAFVVPPGGTQTKHFNLLSKRVAFFGSGNTAVATTVAGLTGAATATKANITAVIRNKSDLRGAQIDIIAGGRRGWGFDEAFNRTELTKKWGPPPDSPTENPPSGGGGVNTGYP